MNFYTEKVPSILPNLQHRLDYEPAVVVPFEREFPPGHLIARHQHTRAQLIYAVQGIMRVDTPQGIWVVPPMRAVWMPAGVDHEIRTSSTVQMRTLFIRPDMPLRLPDRCCVIEVSPLLRELILRMIDDGSSNGSTANAMLELVLREIGEFNVLPLHIPMPSDGRLLRVCHKILDDLSSNKTCSQWGLEVGASARTLERLFLKEAGISFGAWRRQVRLLAALEHLASGRSITNVALDLGYQSASAFTAMFRRTLGRPPSEMYSTR